MKKIFALSAFIFVSGANFLDAGEPTVDAVSAQLSVATTQPAEAENTLKLKLVLPENFKLDRKNHFKVTLYGTDQSVADAAASKINVSYRRIVDGQTLFDLEFPKDAYKYIQNHFRDADEEYSAFYLRIDFDVDGNNQIDEADLVQDFNRSPILFFKKVPEKPIEIRLRDAKSTGTYSDGFTEPFDK